MIAPEPPKATTPIASGELPRPTTPLPTEGDIRATVAISKQEATTGTTRNLNLPGGRRMTVPIPSGVPDGQVIRLENQGEATSTGTTGALVLTIAVAPDETRLAAQKGNENETVRSDPRVVKELRVAAQPSKARRLRFVPRVRAAIIIGIVAVIVLVSSGIFYFKYFNYVHEQSLLNAGPPDPYANFGTMIMNDPLSDNSLGYFWAEGTDSDGGSCEFTGGGYKLVATSQEDYHLCTSNINASDFAYQVQVTILQGNSAGIVFRADNNDNYYYFQIGIDLSYELDAIQSGSPTP